LLRLWGGESDNYPNEIEADIDLLAALARYCDGDPATLDKWFRGSARMRPKWDEPYAFGGGTYGQVCIRSALATGAPTELVTALASDIAPAAVDWLWREILAF